MSRCSHDAAHYETGESIARVCPGCGLRTKPHATKNSAAAEWKVRLALDKRLHGDALSARDEVVLAYGYHAGAHGQRLV